MLYQPAANTHAVYLDHSPTGDGRIAITLARKGNKGPGKRILSLTGESRDIAYSPISLILKEHTGNSLSTKDQDLPPGEYHPINEYCANQMLIAMHVVKRSKKNSNLGSALAHAIARMHNCEAGWWYALFTNRGQPGKVIKALELLYT